MRTISLSIIITLSLGSVAFAQDYAVVHDRERGELSEGARAPTRSGMLSVIQNGAPSAIASTLEYGERVECNACVPVLAGYLLEHPNADVRRMAAWWLRRRILAVGELMVHLRTTLASDANPVRRARAADAIGEFMDSNGVTALVAAAGGDADATVRSSSVRALGRLNHPAAIPTVAAALEDGDAGVRRAAIGIIMRLNFFRDFDALVGALDDSEVEVRRRAALALGELEVAEAAVPLEAMLTGDGNRDCRQAAAWALGRIGGGTSHAALVSAQSSETDARVRDAIRVALAM
jgi:HEAT repeat protein